MKKIDIWDIHRKVGMKFDHLLSGVNVSTEQAHNISSVVGLHIENHFEAIAMSNMIYSYMLVKDINYSYKIINKKLNNTRVSILNGLEIQFQEGLYKENEYKLQNLTTLIVNTKKAIFVEQDKDTSLKENIQYKKLINDLITLTFLLFNNEEKACNISTLLDNINQDEIKYAVSK